jgi:hypothetical protein
MSQSSADLVRGWQAECTVLEQKIANLKAGLIGHALTSSQREDAIKAQMEAVTDFEVLIAEFSRCDIFPIIFEPADPDRKPIIRRRFAKHSQTDTMLVSA